MYRLPHTRATRILILLTLTHVLPSNHTLNGICLFHKNPSYLHFPSATQRLYSFPLFSPIPTPSFICPNNRVSVAHWHLLASPLDTSQSVRVQDQRGAEGAFHSSSTTTNLKTQVSFTFYFCISQLISPAYLSFPLKYLSKGSTM